MFRRWDWRAVDFALSIAEELRKVDPMNASELDARQIFLEAVEKRARPLARVP